ncbi:MAG: hypothetical protein DRJ66_03215 [Thermoprotei archaeon]|nr:MAG: hypothetical protein DRJ66_03215 [Thermoprotei archaeon]
MINEGIMLPFYTLLGILPIMAVVVHALGKTKEKFLLANVSYIASYVLLACLSVKIRSTGISELPLFSLRKAFVLNPTSLTLATLMTFASHMLLLGAYMNRKSVMDKFDVILFMLFSAYGIIFSDNLIILLLFMEIGLVSTAFLFIERNRESIEATVKMTIMLILGGIFLAIGFSGLYLILRSKGLDLIALSLSYLSGTPQLEQGSMSILTLLFFTLILVGMGIEVGLVPFYMWLPDVYTGPMAIASAFFILLVDTADLYALLRVLPLYEHILTGTYTIKMLFTNVVVLISVISFILGELSALTQRRLRRIFGYSGIADAGYTLLLATYLAILGISIVKPSIPLAIATFFILFSNIALSNIVSLIGLGETKGITTIDDIRGLPWRFPLLSANLIISLLSLAGVPPLAGFMAKFFVISAISSTFRRLIVILVIIFFGVCAAYVLRVIATLWSKTSRVTREEESVIQLIPFIILNVLLIICGTYPRLILEFMMR